MPNVDLYEDAPTNKVNLAKLASGKKIIVFAVPGAFTPGCSKVCNYNYLKVNYVNNSHNYVATFKWLKY